MHLNHINKFFLNNREKQEAHRGGAGDGTARAIDGGEDRDRTTLKPTHYTLM